MARRRSQLEASGAGIVLVHPGNDKRAVELFARYGLDDLPRFADPGLVLYRALGLTRGSLLQLFGPRVVWRAATAALRGHRPGRKSGDALQMPGVFLVRGGVIVEAFRHGDVSDRPDYRAIVARVARGTGAEAGDATG